MLKIADRELRGRSDWPLLRANAASLPLASDCFDAVLAVGLVAHFSRPEPIMRELARILNPGGIGIVTFPNVFAWSRIAGLPRSLPMYFSIARRSRWIEVLRRARIVRADTARRVTGAAYSRRGIERLLEASGIEVESITASGFTLWPVFGFEVIPRKLRARLGSILQQRRHKFPWRHLGGHWIVVFKRR